MSRYIHFDWAMKRLLRNKANFDILEGFLTSLLREKVRIRSILESESNKENAEDKFNRVDILAENRYGELFIVEVQNNRELYYFHRMLYGVSKLIAQNIEEGQKYGKIKKVYSINIVYFELGLGKDHAYHGYTVFRGINEPDYLELSNGQKKWFRKKTISTLLPEYYILRVEKFNRKAVTPLDEWVSFLKTGDIPETAKAPGLAAARKKLVEYEMSETERKEYHRHMENLRYQNSLFETQLIEGLDEGIKKGRKQGQKEGREWGHKEGIVKGRKEGREQGRKEGIEKGRKEGVAQSVRAVHRNGFTIEQIMNSFGLSRKKVLEIIKTKVKQY